MEKSTMFNWENALCLWQCSIAMLNCRRVCEITRWHLFVWDLYGQNHFKMHMHDTCIWWLSVCSVAWNSWTYLSVVILCTVYIYMFFEDEMRFVTSWIPMFTGQIPVFTGCSEHVLIRFQLFAGSNTMHHWLNAHDSQQKPIRSSYNPRKSSL